MSTDYAQIAATQVDDGAPTGTLIDRYASGVALLRDAFADMDAEQRLATPVEGKMSTHGVVCHIVDCDQFLADRLKRIIAMDHPLLVGADGWLYPQALHYDERDLDLDMELLDVTRRQMAADLRRVDDAAWERVGVHTETGLVTLRQMLFHAIRHLEWHVGTIGEKRAALGLD